uniref:Uncharacterized protein n=1 Tax=Romanomermis culicivorax TaxID=13658 RepID=A0A915IIW5_ROMCU
MLGFLHNLKKSSTLSKFSATLSYIRRQFVEAIVFGRASHRGALTFGRSLRLQRRIFDSSYIFEFKAGKKIGAVTTAVVDFGKETEPAIVVFGIKIGALTFNLLVLTTKCGGGNCKFLDVTTVEGTSRAAAAIAARFL